MSDPLVPHTDAPALDTPTRLAYLNVFLALERTQMSWVQLVLALISFGFTIAKAFEVLHQTRNEVTPLLGGRTVGILMIAIGLVSLTLASVQHQSALKSLRRQCPGLPVSQAGLLAVMLAALGTLALVISLWRN